MNIERAGHAREKSTGDEGDNAVISGIDAGCGGGDFIVAHGFDCLAHGGAHEAADKDKCQRSSAKYPGGHVERLINFVDQTRAGPVDVNAETSGGAEGGDCHDDVADDFSEAESCDGEIEIGRAHV